MDVLCESHAGSPPPRYERQKGVRLNSWEGSIRQNPSSENAQKKNQNDQPGIR
jgi:hypothetical protein